MDFQGDITISATISVVESRNTMKDIKMVLPELPYNVIGVSEMTSQHSGVDQRCCIGKQALNCLSSSGGYAEALSITNKGLCKLFPSKYCFAMGPNTSSISSIRSPHYS